MTTPSGTEMTPDGTEDVRVTGRSPALRAPNRRAARRTVSSFSLLDDNGNFSRSIA